MGFDIMSLRNAAFPKVVCPRCGYLFAEFPTPRVSTQPKPHIIGQCKNCEQIWDPGSTLSEFFVHCGTSIQIPDFVDHVVHFSNDIEKEVYNPRLHLVFALLADSKAFIHFNTLNISNEWLGILAMAAARVPVRGVIGIINAGQQRLIDFLQKAAPNLDLYIYSQEKNFDAPHQKLLVFDGIVAILGSTNLTTNAWIKADEFKESVEVITDIDQVRSLNNKYFASQFRTTSEWFNEDTLIDLPF